MRQRLKTKGLFSHLAEDLPGGLVVFFVALPLCLGIALASEAPIVSGLIAGVIGGLVVGFLSASTLGVSGPAAGLAVIVVNALTELGSFEVFLSAVVLTGFFQVLLGFLRAGIIAYYFPSSVITGMLSGIGILIILKQIPHAFGIDQNPEGQEAFLQPDGQNTFSEVIEALSHISLGPLLICVASLVILLAWDQPWFKKNKMGTLPGALVAILVGVMLSLSFSSIGGLSLEPSQLVAIPALDSLASVREIFVFPDLSALWSDSRVYKIALVMAVVASLETLLCVEATDKIDPDKRITPTNRELKAQGLGNIVSGLLGGLPITQVIVRSSANVQAGSKTKLATLVHGVLLLLSVLFFHGLMNQVPLASLAAILFLVGYKLAHPSVFKKMWAGGRTQFIPFLVTIVGILTSDLLFGVFAGLLTAMVAILYENFRLPFSVKKLEQGGREKVVIKLSQQMTFLHKAALMEILKNVKEESSVHIDASEASYIHPDIKEILTDFYSTSGAKKQSVELSPPKKKSLCVGEDIFYISHKKAKA